jgi:hypothetical protein
VFTALVFVFINFFILVNTSEQLYKKYHRLRSHPEPVMALFVHRQAESNEMRCPVVHDRMASSFTDDERQS